MVIQIRNPLPETLDPQTLDPQNVVIQIRNPLPETLDSQTLDPQTLDPQTLDPQRQMGQMTVKRSGVPAFVFPEIPQIFCLGSFAFRVYAPIVTRGSPMRLPCEAPP